MSRLGGMRESAGDALRGEPLGGGDVDDAGVNSESPVACVGVWPSLARRKRRVECGMAVLGGSGRIK